MHDDPVFYLSSILIDIEDIPVTVRRNADVTVHNDIQQTMSIPMGLDPSPKVLELCRQRFKLLAHIAELELNLAIEKESFAILQKQWMDAEKRAAVENK